MDGHFAYIVVIILAALVFDFINGFHDAANSIATVVGTRVLSPQRAVGMAAFFNFAAIFFAGTAVAKTVGAGMVESTVITPNVVFAALIGAIFWNLLTWWLGLPSSSTHALLGGLAGAGMAAVSATRGFSHSFEALVLHWPLTDNKWFMTVLFIFLAPLVGMLMAYVLMIAVYWLFRDTSRKHMDVWFRWLQLASSATLSFAHGSNDAQKTAGIITALLVATGKLKSFQVPLWVIVAAYTSIGLGTLSGGWRIVHTMGSRLTKLKPRGGFCAETAAAFSILLAGEGLGLPVSTTHVTAGAIAGVGSIQRFKAVRWGLATNIVWAWVFTIPAATVVGWIAMLVIMSITGTP